MINISKGIYWEPWSLVDGCTPCSPGCVHCWSASMALRFHKKTNEGYLLVNNRGKFFGMIQTHPERLDIPLKRRKPTVYAVWNDLFHEDVPWDFRDKAYAMMQKCDQHTYLVLSKRPQNMMDYIASAMFDENCNYDGLYEEMEALGIGDKEPLADNVYHGLTVCNQQEADEKIRTFQQIPGKKFLSIEPMLSEISLRWFSPSRDWYENKLETTGFVDEYDGLRLFDAVILGGETGPGARPMHPDWAIGIVQQCRAAGVPVFVKQIHINGKVSKDMNEWPEELRVRDLPWCKNE